MNFRTSSQVDEDEDEDDANRPGWTCFALVPWRFPLLPEVGAFHVLETRSASDCALILGGLASQQLHRMTAVGFF